MMSQNSNVARYREHLRYLDYPEYAPRPAHDMGIGSDDVGITLNLALWNDELLPGVEEAALRALQRAIGAYRPAQDTELVTSLAEKIGVEPDSVFITAGADDALRIASQYSIRPGTRTLIPVPSFGRYIGHAKMQQAALNCLPFDSYPYEFDVARIVEEVYRKEVECLFLASPNNPTGHALGRESIESLLDSVSCTVILDEALLVNMPYGSSAGLVDAHQNLFICGSLSKLYGMPGARVGYLLANLVHREGLQKLISPFGVNGMGLEIAKYALTQDEWLQRRVAALAGGIAILNTIDSPDSRVTHSSAPVALVEHTGDKGSLYRMLRARGVASVAGKDFPGLDNANAVRVIIRSVQDMLQLKQILADLS